MPANTVIALHIVQKRPTYCYYYITVFIYLNYIQTNYIITVSVKTCEKAIDIAFLMDTSDSMDDEKWQATKGFIEKFIAVMNLDNVKIARVNVS